MANIKNVHVCPHCVAKCRLTEVKDVYENANLVGFDCPKCGMQVVIGKKTDIELGSLTKAAAWSLGWNMRLLGKILIESVKQGLKDLKKK